MTYQNRVIERTAPLTPCQCAVMAMLTDRWSSVEAIWKRDPRYARANGRTHTVAYGTVCSILASLVQQGFASQRKVQGKHRVEYRRL